MDSGTLVLNPVDKQVWFHPWGRGEIKAPRLLRHEGAMPAGTGNDRFAFSFYTRDVGDQGLIVLNPADKQVWYHKVEPDVVRAPRLLKHEGAMPAGTGNDRFAFDFFQGVMVLNPVDKQVWYHKIEVENNVVRAPVLLKFEGAMPAGTPKDRFAFEYYRVVNEWGIMVLNPVDKQVWYHKIELDNNVVRAPLLFRHEGAMPAGTDNDRFVILHRGNFVVLNPADKQVWLHKVDVSSSLIKAPQLLKYEGAMPAGTPKDRFAMTVGSFRAKSVLPIQGDCVTETPVQ